MIQKKDSADCFHRGVRVSSPSSVSCHCCWWSYPPSRRKRRCIHMATRFFPSEVSLGAYQYLFASKDKLLHSYGMSFLVTAVGTFGNVAITAMFAYPLSNKELPGRNFFSFFIFFTMLFNGGLIPTYLVYTQAMHVKDTIWALIVPQAVGERLLRHSGAHLHDHQYSHRDTGCFAHRRGQRYVYLHAGCWLPLSLPILATVGFMSGLAYWNDWQNGLYYLVRRTDLFTIQNLLNRILSSADALRNSSTNEMMAAGFEIPSGRQPHGDLCVCHAAHAHRVSVLPKRIL